VALRRFVTVADSLQPFCRNAKLLQHVSDTTSAMVSQSQVVLGGSPFVAMAFHHDAQIWKLIADGPQQCGIRTKRGQSVGSHFETIIVKKGIAQSPFDVREYDSRISPRRDGRMRCGIVPDLQP
jgi:hypothetical protein